MAQLDHLAGQMSFLTDAAHLLAKSAPETSAYLMSRRNALLLCHDTPLSDVQRQHVCTSCGHIIVPGHEDALKVEAAAAVQSKTRPRQRLSPKTPKPPALPTAGSVASSKERRGASKTYTCGMCHRYTKITLPPAPAIVRRRPKVAETSAAPSSSASNPTAGNAGAEKPQPSANSSSKKRAKSRKAGLQALLSQAQKDTARKPGLSLADFMKK
ncbi:hypothetical protein MAPG_10097 [Magnaporthiopsis poae ATCC 64411]|uniref:Uncharacterized protein n=1 Tax=Magnaporthiopsis poae (strain ATCC 64411 / 73-15) TaxID=644358 RepID=A0A0C4EBP3_MAGP6|nr:hypothetical protein MAPG_10097 [Magnaporthiopsis poae ATCC 64411]